MTLKTLGTTALGY